MRESYLRIMACEDSKYSKKVSMEISITTSPRLVNYTPLKERDETNTLINVVRKKRDAKAYMEQYVNDYYNCNKYYMGYKSIRLIHGIRQDGIFLLLTYVINEE